VTDDDKEFVISDGLHLYHVGLVREPEAHLEALATNNGLSEPIQTPVATLGKYAFGANHSGALQVFQLPELTLASPLETGADVVWGPRRIGNLVLAATAGDELLAIDENAKVIWRYAMRFGPLAGAPAIDRDAVLFASQSGHMETISLRDGRQVASANVGQPLGSGLVPFSNHWLTASADGIVLLVQTPDSAPASDDGGAGE
jgi:hypothetical protein